MVKSMMRPGSHIDNAQISLIGRLLSWNIRSLDLKDFVPCSKMVDLKFKMKYKLYCANSSLHSPSEFTSRPSTSCKIATSIPI